MSATLGIDHPLVLFRDLNRGVERFRALGFEPAPIGYHPWGTNMSFVTFERSAFELMSIYDAGLIDLHPAGDFRFGRYVAERLSEREGLSLIALYSADHGADTERVMARGIACQGAIEFGRAVRLPDGREDRTATTLRILYDPALKRVSHFVCQQHRPDLVWLDRWMAHPNGATGIASVTYCAPRPEALRARFAGLYGAPALAAITGGFMAQTGNGRFEIVDVGTAVSRFGRLPAAIDGTEAAGLAVAVRVKNLRATRDVLLRAGVEHVAAAERILVTHPEFTGNLFIEFVVEPS